MNRPGRRSRLLVLTQMYRPEPNFITADVAEAMARHMDVMVITAHPNYPQGRFYQGTRWWRPIRTVENGVTVWRLPFFPYQGRSQVRRALAYLSFVVATVVWAPLVAGRRDLVWIYHGPFTAGPAALWFKFVFRARVVLTCADLWPEAFLASGVARPGLVMRVLFAYRRWINRQADVLICSTKGTLNQLMTDGVDAASLHYVPVWVDGISPAPPGAVAPPGGPRRIVYAGNLGPAQNLETVVRAAAEWHRQGIDVAVDLYGTGNSEAALRQLASEAGASNVTFHGRVSPEKAFEVSSVAFAQLVSLQASPFFAMSVPSKISFCCAAGAPVLYGLQGEPAAMLEASGGGIPFGVSDPPSLVGAVKELLARTPGEHSRMRSQLRHYYDQTLARSLLLERYEGILLAQTVDLVEKPTPTLDRHGGEPR